MATSIPVRNLYYLFLYAWNRFEEGQAVETGATESPDAPALFAKVLANGVRRLLRRGLERGYLELVEETPVPRGRILVSDTVKTNALSRRRVIVRHDELAVDVPHNRVLKATLLALASADGIDADQAQELRNLAAAFSGIAELPLSRDLFRRVQLARNNRHYDLLVHVCALVAECLLPEEGGRSRKFADVLADKVRMPAVFEAFVRNFLSREQKEFMVAIEELRWDATCVESWQLRHLPTMQTDMTLRSPDRTIVIDTKFYRDTLVSRWGGADKVQSQHLYQILAYLRHTTVERQPSHQPEGLLVYPRSGHGDIKLDYVLAGYRISVRTIALDQDWQQIHSDLIAMLEPVSPSLDAAGS